MKISFLSAVTLFMTAGTAYAASLAPDVTAIDTIAGFGTTLETGNTLPNRNLSLFLEHPDGTKEVYEVKTDGTGSASLDIFGEDLTKAGLYTVYSKYDNVLGDESTFTVYPDEVSSAKSTANAAQRTAALDNPILLTVKLKDQYGNAVRGHEVTVISSREEDTVSTVGGKPYTSSTGEVLFNVESNEPGVSVYSVFDTTSGKVLKNRPEVYFETEYSRLSYAGGDYDNLVADASTVSYLAIEGIKSPVALNKNISFTVTAYNAGDKVVTDYTGTVHISAPGENGNMVELPEVDYVFTKDDLGSHTYSLGLKFLQEGLFSIEAIDIDDLSVTGMIDVTVGTGVKPSVGAQIAGEYNFTLTSPLPATYSQTVQTLAGSAPPGFTIGFYDNDEEFGFTEADADGNYTFETTPLAEGEHTLLAVLLDENFEIIAEVDPVTIVIDASVPLVDSVEILPIGDVEPGSSLTVTVHTEEGLTSVIVKIGTESVTLQPTASASTYTGTVNAPAKAGAYDVTVSLTDALGNEALYDGQGTVTVLHGGALEGGFNVIGVSVIPSDSKVTLIWKVAESPAGIKNYRIYYGTDPNLLTYAVDTFANSPTWYIPNLRNGTPHYFAVTAIDSLGNESPQMSEIVESTPFVTETFQGLNPVQDPLNPGSYYTYFPAQTGPEILWIVVIALFVSGLYFSIKRR
ncbi:MAG: fibronectin type III domain-containing protein [Patescibacteria group bacterium]|nr:fibronectin type III domain-containing protein [Patescibacteria group bacterium]